MSIVTLNDRGVRSVTTFGSVSGGSMVFIKKLTASSSATLSFVDGSSDVVLDNTYKEYLFTFKDIHPSVDGAKFSFQGNAAGGSGYNETITSTSFRTYHNEADNDTTLSYTTDGDQAQGTAFQISSEVIIGNDNDQCGAGFLRLFNPSSTTFVKHFIGTFQVYDSDNYSATGFFAGYFNTTSAIDEIQFKMHSGNIDAGDICLYGIL
tara:strand:- start:4 stop:624 length:621 start_codon:yes stop_codon:yes gene_type:complete